MVVVAVLDCCNKSACSRFRSASLSFSSLPRGTLKSSMDGDEMVLNWNASRRVVLFVVLFNFVLAVVVLVLALFDGL